MFDKNLIELAKENDNFRKVVYTTERTQIVLMSLQSGEDIGMESHSGLDQILSIVSGSGKAIINGEEEVIGPGSVIVVPENAQHNFVNTGKEQMKLWTVYAPPEHRPDAVHRTKSEAEQDKSDHF